jgi:rubrerythrin
MRMVEKGEKMRLIDADKAYKVLTEYYHHKTDVQHDALKEALGKVPTVDASPVKYGKWLDADDGIDWTCSRCGHDVWADTPFCPNCGAKMSEKGS